jgi:hypothetical protein
MALPLDPHFVRHLLSFQAGVILAMCGARKLLAGFALASVLGTALVFWPEFASPLAAVVALLIGTLPLGRSSRPFALVSQATYEFFLVHGPIYLGLALLLRLDLAENLVVGTLAGIAATWVLRRVTQEVRGLPVRLAQVFAGRRQAA